MSAISLHEARRRTAYTPEDEVGQRPFAPLLDEEVAPKIKASPFVWTDPARFPRREWLFGTHLIRKFVSATMAPGGLGKTSLLLIEAVAMATGRNLTGSAPRKGPLRVWVVNLEDPREEIERRVLAILLHYQIDPEDLGDRLFLDSGREVSIVLATANRNGVEVATPTVEALKAEIKAREIDVLIVDPFVKSHGVQENDNSAIDKVVTAFAGIADATACAIELVHHVRKTGSNEITVEDGRGAVAMLAGVRSARVLNPMTKEEAQEIGGDIVPREHFRVTNGKANLAPPPEASQWFRLHSVDLGNGDPRDLADTGDRVAVVAPWEYPGAFSDVTTADLKAVQTTIAAKRWRANPQSPEWAGHAIADVLRLDVSDIQAQTKVKKLLGVWTKNGMFREVEGLDENRKKKRFVEVGTWA